MSNSKRSGERDGISFSDEDLKGLEVPHNDPLVVSMTVANTKLDKIFVTSGFKLNLLYISTLEQKLGLTRNLSKQAYAGNYGEKLEPIGTITLPITAGDSPRDRTVMVEFMVMDNLYAYDIFGCGGLAALQALASTYHQVMRFPTKAGLG